MPWRISNRFLIILFLIISTSVLIGPAASIARDLLTIGGSGSSLGTIKILAKVFERSHPEIKVKVLPSLGSAGAVRALSKKAIDIGLVTRSLTKEESTVGLVVTPYAISPFIFVANRKAGITNITHNEIVKIYEGEWLVWPCGERIRTPLRQRNETDIRIVKAISPAMSNAMETAMSRPGMIVANTDQDNSDLIESVPGAFGFSTLTQVIAEKRRLIILSYEGVRPTIKNLVNRSYPFSKPFFTVTREQTSEPARKFLRFMRSPKGRAILQKTGNLAIHK